MLFLDRQDAGQQLAELLMEYRHEDPIVLALPRGGVVVAAPVAKALGANLDVLVVRKLGAPEQPELGIGAIATGNVRVLSRDLIRMLGITDSQLERVTFDEGRELARREAQYRGERPMPDLKGRTVIIVDDGLATGVTARAAIRSVRQMQPKRIVLAVPVTSPETADALCGEVEDLVSVNTPTDLISVGSWYRNFDQVSDAEVLRLLNQSRQEHKLPY